MGKRLLALLCVVSFILGGCGKNGERQLAENEIFSVGGNICTLTEAQIFILSQRTVYESSYGEAIWQSVLPEGSFEEYVKRALLDYLEFLFLLDRAASEAEIVLSEAENKSVIRAAESFMSDLGKSAEKLGITQGLAESAYRRYAKAQIYYRKLMQLNVREISDEEARAVRLQIVALPQSIGMSRAQEVCMALQDGKDAKKTIQEIEGASVRQETLVRGKYTNSFDTIVFALKQDQWSTILTVGREYYIVHCLSPYDETETARNKAVMEQAMRESVLEEAMEQYSGGISLSLNPNAWESWKMKDYSGLPYVDFYKYADAFVY